MAMKSTLLTLALLGAALPALAIEGGIPTSAFGQVASGVQVAPNWVLTANHVGLVAGSTYSNGYGSSTVAERYELNSGLFPLDDIALLRLSDAIAAPELAINASLLSAGSGYNIAATIVTGSNQSPRGYAFSAVREFLPQIDPDDAGPEGMVNVNWLVTYLDGYTGPYVQGGDSGGGLFLGQVTEASTPLWGITSALIYDETAGGERSNYRSAFVQVASYRDWIDAAMSADLSDSQQLNWVITSVPEASTTALLGLGLLVVAGLRLRTFLLRGRHASLAGCSGSSRTGSTFRSLRSVRLA